MSYHFTCWRRFERMHRAKHPEFNWRVSSCRHVAAAAHCMSGSACAMLDFLLALLAPGNGLACIEDHPMTGAGMALTADMAVQNKDGLQCFTDGCTGRIKLAMELEAEAGINTHRRELLRLPEQARKLPERPQQQEGPEQRRARKRGPVQKVPEPGARLSWGHETRYMSQLAM